MTRNASDCLLCHLTGLFGAQRQKEYDDWLLQEIAQIKGLAFPAIHFSEIHTGLNISTMWKEKDNWQALNEMRNKFDVLQLNVEDVSSEKFIEFLNWNQNLDKPFYVFTVLSIQAVKDASTNTIEDAYTRLRQAVEMVFSVCQLPVSAISFENADFLWKESAGNDVVEPRNHYLLRHIRSAMDRIDARQTLFVHSQGSFADVEAYFSDGNNEIQLAGSAELNAMLVKCLQEENSALLAGITSQFRLNSLETAYFHTLTNSSNLSDAQRDLFQKLVLTLTGIPVLNYESVNNQKLKKILDLRMNHAALNVHGAQIQLGSHESIWSIQRYSMDMSQSLLCLANFSAEEQQITLGEEDLVTDECWNDVFTGEEFVAGKIWTLNPYQVLVLI